MSNFQNGLVIWSCRSWVFLKWVPALCNEFVLRKMFLISKHWRFLFRRWVPMTVDSHDNDYKLVGILKYIWNFVYISTPTKNPLITIIWYFWYSSGIILWILLEVCRHLLLWKHSHTKEVSETIFKKLSTRNFKNCHIEV